jgi:hypothetical protein
MNVHDQLKKAGITPTSDAHKAYELGRKSTREAPKPLPIVVFRPRQAGN